MHISWTRLASFCQLGFISDPLIVSKFHNETHDPKRQENKIYTIVKGMDTTSPDIILGTETGLSDDIRAEEIFNTSIG